jgi:hypothetical protein
VVLALDFRTIGSSEGEPRCEWFPEHRHRGAPCPALRGRPGDVPSLGLLALVDVYALTVIITRRTS